ncbi:hypothetical protein [Chryseobacterium sp.]|jgi:hypothetical protein|uniref:hypothetical protein n=1 Tax=Chryseobacterium sp. TaxID=1871047 RepID=UPI00283CB068|nr:hypothetical protein [Chryseobacterium sp.]MDR3026047.1 hypothetical protein [Chryseobacterium sp.]
MKLTKAQREILYKKYGGKCAYCGCELPERWLADVIVDPIRNSKWNNELQKWEYVGLYKNSDLESIDNRNPCCKSCDVHKSSKTLEQFRQSLYGLLKLVTEEYGYYKILNRFGMLQETGQKVRFFFETYERKEITKHLNHYYFTVQEEHLYEVYKTIRGIRYLVVCDVPGIPDTEQCNDDLIKYVEREYL